VVGRRLFMSGYGYGYGGSVLGARQSAVQQRPQANPVRSAEARDFALSKPRLEWESPQAIGLGLRNLGNTCFLNAVLQCLSHTAPLANGCLRRQHTHSCPLYSNCGYCLLELHISRALRPSEVRRDAYGYAEAVAPSAIYDRLTALAKHFVRGRQEDAHEFMRFTVEALDHACLRNAGRSTTGSGPLEKPPTLIQNTFQGQLCSSVTCMSCGRVSVTKDPFMDLSLELSTSGGSVHEALAAFTKDEQLGGDNAYKCEHCKRSTSARKRIAVREAPPILVLHLKRFSAFGSKIGAHVGFGERLSLASFLSDDADEGERSPAPAYELYGVVVHAGGTMDSGHYYAYVRTDAADWHRLDDSFVQPVSRETVLHDNAYILFYKRLPSAEAAAVAAAEERAAAAAATQEMRRPFIGPERPPTASTSESGGGGGGGAFIGPHLPPALTQAPLPSVLSPAPRLPPPALAPAPPPPLSLAPAPHRGTLPERASTSGRADLPAPVVDAAPAQNDSRGWSGWHAIQTYGSDDDEAEQEDEEQEQKKRAEHNAAASAGVGEKRKAAFSLAPVAAPQKPRVEFTG